MSFKKLDKHLGLTVATIAVLIVATVIIMNLSVGWFTIVMPIIAGAIFLAILLLPEDEEKEKPQSKK